MTYKEKLIKLLKIDEEVKDTMEKLEFGCIITRCWSNHKMISWNEFFDKNNRIFYNIEDNNFRDDKIQIIWLPLQDRFIRMYCENKKIYFIQTTWHIWLWEKYQISIKIDNKKDFDQQDDEVYKQIFNFLKDL